MKIVYNSFLPFPGYAAIMLFGCIFARKKYKPLSRITINHEAIHDAQASDCGGYWRYYWKYLKQWVKYGYRESPFEREAYANERNMNYLQTRTAEAWTRYE